MQLNKSISTPSSTHNGTKSKYSIQGALDIRFFSYIEAKQWERQTVDLLIISLAAIKENSGYYDDRSQPHCVHRAHSQKGSFSLQSRKCALVSA